MFGVIRKASGVYEGECNLNQMGVFWIGAVSIEARSTKLGAKDGGFEMLCSMKHPCKIKRGCGYLACK
jgi:hypothetical protein